MGKQTMKTYAAMMVAALFWGFSFIWTKMVLDIYQPITIVIIRLVLSSIFLWVIGFAFNKLEKITFRDFWLLFLLAFFQPFLYFIGETIGLSYVSSTVASVIIATIPLFSPIAAYYFFKEKLSLMNFIGIMVSVVGVLLVIMKDDLELSYPLWGIFLLFMAVLAAVAYSVVIVKLAGKYNVYSVITYQNTIGVVMFLPLFLTLEVEHFLSVPFQWDAWIPLVELAIFASSFAFMLFTYGIQKLGVTKANTLANIIPVFTAVFAYFMIDERLGLINIIGIIIVIAGLFLSQINRKMYLRLRMYVKPEQRNQTK